MWKHPFGSFVLKSVGCFCNGRCIKSKFNSCSKLPKRACAQCFEGVLEISTSSNHDESFFWYHNSWTYKCYSLPSRAWPVHVCVCVGSGQGGIVVSERVRSSAPLTPHCWETRKGAEWNLPSATSLWDSNTAEPNALADTVVYSAYKPHLTAVVLPFTGF